VGNLIWTVIVVLCVTWLLGMVFSFGGPMLFVLPIAAAILAAYSQSAYRGARI